VVQEFIPDIFRVRMYVIPSVALLFLKGELKCFGFLRQAEHRMFFLWSAIVLDFLSCIIVDYYRIGF
jgi:hypothetical protein